MPVSAAELAGALREPEEGELEPVFSRLAEQRHTRGLETIYEGYLVHYGRPRLFEPEDEHTALVRRDERARLFDAVRGAATFYITITFVVFALFLSGLQEELDTHIAFTNFVVHYLIPVVVVVDWFIDPPRHSLGLRIALSLIAYPLA